LSKSSNHLGHAFVSSCSCVGRPHIFSMPATNKSHLNNWLIYRSQLHCPSLGLLCGGRVDVWPAGYSSCLKSYSRCASASVVSRRLKNYRTTRVLQCCRGTGVQVLIY